MIGMKEYIYGIILNLYFVFVGCDVLIFFINVIKNSMIILYEIFVG